MKTKSTKPANRFLFGALSIGMLTACGGDGSVDIADGGIRGTGSSVGPVSGFGSVIVNGVKFSTDNIMNRAVTSDDGITVESELSEGMIIRVEGQWRDDGEGTATSLSYDDTLRGPVTAIEPDPSGTGEFVTVIVMGQAVRLDGQSVVRGTTFANLLAGNGVGLNVRVSAWRQADGSYRAGYLGVLGTALVGEELEGSVSNVDVGQNEFDIGNVTVQYTDSVVFGSGLTEADLESLEVVEVEGNFSLNGNLFIANSIDRDDARRFARDGNDDVQLTATMDTDYAADGISARPGEFAMGGLTVRVTANTELDDELLLSDLKAGLLVQVEGDFISDTVVEADEIGLREGNAKVKGVIETNSVATNPDQFVVGGVTVRVTPLTVLAREDGGLQDFQSLAAGTDVEVEGIERSEAGSVFIEALKVEVDDEQDGDNANEFELEGRLTSMTPTPGANGLVILGVNMSDLGAEYDGDGANPRNDIYNAFLASEKVILEVEYLSSSAGFVAEEVELEETDND